jgi:hypothetical protein
VITLWAACKCDAAGVILASSNVVGVAVMGAGIYHVQMVNELGPNECSAGAVPWYGAPSAVPLVRFVCGVDPAMPSIIIVNGFAGIPPVPAPGPFDLIVWRFSP